VSRSLNQDELLQFIIRTASEILDCESVSILLYDEKRDHLIFADATGSDPKQLAETPLPLNNSLAGTIFRENKVVCLSNVQHDARHYLAVSKMVNIDEKKTAGRADAHP
jgi:signal transduction protein with GAF and PtsI domain